MQGRSGLAVLVATVVACASGNEGGFTPVVTDGGTTAPCHASADCDDHVACTRDLCLVGGVCEHDADNTPCTAPQVCIAATGCGIPGAMACRASADCDDHVVCTRDQCLVDGTCQHTALDGMCPTGQTCNAATGCGTPGMGGACRMASDCDDHIACTDDQCGVDGLCVHVPQNARCTALQVCAAGMGCVAQRACSSNHDCDDGLRCNGMETCSELACSAGVPIDCNSHDPCMMDGCVETGTTPCVHMANPMCTVSVRTGIYTTAMALTYMCTAFDGSPAVSINISFLQFAVSAGMLTVTPGPMGAMMTGPAPTGATFSVTGTVAGGCQESYQLMGTFTDATHFTGRFSYSFAGLDCALTDCAAGSFTVMGTARAM